MIMKVFVVLGLIVLVALLAYAGLKKGDALRTLDQDDES